MTEAPFTQENGNEEVWRHVFAVGAADLLDQHRYHLNLPSPPRCRLCKAPFAGIGGFFLRFRGKRPSKRNPNFCSACDSFLANHPGGAQVPMSLLYADIRKSTEFARSHPPAEIAARVNTFLDLATRAINAEDGFILAFYGDCVVANWPPGFSGPDYIARAARAGREVARSSTEAGIPVGVGLHSGEAFMASVQANNGGFRDISVFGEAVNLVARLSSAARPGEVIMTHAVAEADGSGTADDTIEIKGFDAPVRVRRVQYPA